MQLAFKLNGKRLQIYQACACLTLTGGTITQNPTVGPWQYYWQIMATCGCNYDDSNLKCHWRYCSDVTRTARGSTDTGSVALAVVVDPVTPSESLAAAGRGGTAGAASDCQWDPAAARLQCRTRSPDPEAAGPVALHSVTLAQAMMRHSVTLCIS